MAKYRISHDTEYSYEHDVDLSRHVLHLSPRLVAHQILHGTEVRITPTPSVRADNIDAFGNPVTMVAIEEDHAKLLFNSTIEVTVQTQNVPDLSRSTPFATLSTSLEAGSRDIALEIYQYACATAFTQPTPDIVDFTLSAFSEGRPVLEGAQALTEMIFKSFTYDPRATNAQTLAGHAMSLKRGVCQDYTHVMLAGLRALGLPARYVSGYLLTHPPAGKPRLVGADASHAWVSVYCPQFGWVDFDPTNNVIPAEEHITIAYGRDYADISPVNGVILGGGRHRVAVSVDVAPVER